MKPGIIIVDHGSRARESNQLLETITARFRERFAGEFPIVEPAHMELALPSIAHAYSAVVEQGATTVIVCPFFLGPGKHWREDIPRLVAEAAEAHPHTCYRITGPLGVDSLMLDLLSLRIGETLLSGAST
jgi:sirohydrochlorin ferrochelatase